MSESDPFIILARIGAPNGVRGAARVKLFGDDPASLADGPLQRADGKGSVVLTGLRPGKTPDMVVATFDGITNREQVAELNGVELGLLRSALPDVEDEDDFYHTDLIGLEARLIDGSRFGEIMQVANYGADDLLDLKPDRGGPTVLVPFTKAIVPTVKLADGYVVLDPPEGLLDPPKKKPSEADGG